MRDFLLCRPTNSRLCILWWIVRASETPQKHPQIVARLEPVAALFQWSPANLSQNLCYTESTTARNFDPLDSFNSSNSSRRQRIGTFTFQGTRRISQDFHTHGDKVCRACFICFTEIKWFHMQVPVTILVYFRCMNFIFVLVGRRRPSTVWSWLCWYSCRSDLVCELA